MSGLKPEEVVELKHSLAGMAELLWGFQSELKGQGFSDSEALRLTSVWLTAVMRGQVGGDET